MSGPIKVTCEDTDTGETATRNCVPGDYVLICADPCYVDSFVRHGNGTVQIVIKGHRPQQSTQDGARA